MSVLMQPKFSVWNSVRVDSYEVIKFLMNGYSIVPHSAIKQGV